MSAASSHSSTTSRLRRVDSVRPVESLEQNIVTPVHRLRPPRQVTREKHRDSAALIPFVARVIRAKHCDSATLTPSAASSHLSKISRLFRVDSIRRIELLRKISRLLSSIPSAASSHSGKYRDSAASNHSSETSRLRRVDSVRRVESLEQNIVTPSRRLRPPRRATPENTVTLLRRLHPPRRVLSAKCLRSCPSPWPHSILRGCATNQIHSKHSYHPSLQPHSTLGG